MADRDLFQMEDTDVKRTSKDLALVWDKFERLVDIEKIGEKAVEP